MSRLRSVALTMAIGLLVLALPAFATTFGISGAFQPVTNPHNLIHRIGEPYGPNSSNDPIGFPGFQYVATGDTDALTITNTQLQFDYSTIESTLSWSTPTTSIIETVIENGPPECSDPFPPPGCEAYPIVHQNVVAELMATYTSELHLSLLPAPDSLDITGGSGSAGTPAFTIAEISSTVTIEAFLDGELTNTRQVDVMLLDAVAYYQCGGTSVEPFCYMSYEPSSLQLLHLGSQIVGTEFEDFGLDPSQFTGTLPELPRASIAIAPEPSTASLLALGLVALARSRQPRRRRASLK